MSRARPSRRWLRSALVAAPLAGGALLVLVFILHGGSWWVVESPSMGTAAPVGALVVTSPLRDRPPQVGEIVTYAPRVGPTTVTHRVVAVEDLGIRTRGDANGGEDPWIVPVSAVRGRAAVILPGAGFLLRSAPILAAGAALALVAATLVRDASVRLALGLVIGSSAVCAAVVLLRPLVDVDVTGVVTTPTATEVRLVGTGLLPVRVAAEGRSVDLVSGGEALLRLPPGIGSRIELATSLHLTPAGWAAFAAVCAVPLLVATARAARPAPA